MSILPKAIFRFNAIPIKTPTVFFTERGQAILQFAWNCKQPELTKAMRSKNTAAGVPQPYFKTDYKAVVIETAG